MLILTRQPGEGIRLFPDATLPDVTPISAIQWPVQALVLGVRGKQVRLGIACDERVTIMRDVHIADYPGSAACNSAVLESLKRHTEAAIAAVAEALRIVEDNSASYLALQEAQKNLCVARNQFGQ